MAIKIIKEGKKEFEYTCPYCGCVFTYELEDIEPGDIVECPCCHEQLHINKLKGITNYPYPNMIPCRRGTETIPEDIKIWYDTKPGYTQVTKNPCENCHIYRKMLKGEYVVDDSCYWCPNNPNKVTCGTGFATLVNTYTDSITNGTDKDIKEGKIKAYNSSNHIKGGHKDV